MNFQKDIVLCTVGACFALSIMGNIYQYIKSTEDFYIVSSKLKETDADERHGWTRYSLYYPGGVRDTIFCFQDFRNENEYVIIHNDVLVALQDNRKYQEMVVDELRKKYNILMTIVHLSLIHI